MDETKTITLKHPVKLGDTEVTEIVLCEPTIGQIEKALKEAHAVSSNVVLIAQVAKISPAEVRLMAASDFNEAVEYLSGFTKPAQEPGED